MKQSKPEINVSWDTDLNKADLKIYLSGDTYPIRTHLSKAGYRWMPVTRVWWISMAGRSPHTEAEKFRKILENL